MEKITFSIIKQFVVRVVYIVFVLFIKQTLLLFQIKYGLKLKF